MSSRKILHFAILCITVLLVYHPVYRFDFLYGWDDQWFVTNHFTEDEFKLDNLTEIFTKFYRGQYAPINQLYYTFVYSIFRYQPGVFHSFSVLLHFVNVVLVYELSRNLRVQLSSFSGQEIDVTAFFTALLFAVLPINVEAVAWVSAAKVLWYAFFYLLAVLMYIRYIKYKKAKHFYGVLIFFTFSFLSKEQAVVLPLTLILIDWVYRRNLKSTDLWLEKIPFFILAILFGLITIASQELDDGQRSFYPLYQRLPLALFTFMEYVTKSIIPVNLSYLYPFPFQLGDSVPWWMWIYVVFAPFILYAGFKLRDRTYIFSLLFFLINIVIVVNLVSIARHSVIADRYTYVASIAVAFFLVEIFSRIYKWSRSFSLVISILFVVSIMGYSIFYVNAWENAYSVKERLKKTIERRDDFEELKKLK